MARDPSLLWETYSVIGRLLPYFSKFINFVRTRITLQTHVLSSIWEPCLCYLFPVGIVIIMKDSAAVDLMIARKLQRSMRCGGSISSEMVSGLICRNTEPLESISQSETDPTRIFGTSSVRSISHLTHLKNEAVKHWNEVTLRFSTRGNVFHSETEKKSWYGMVTRMPVAIHIIWTWWASTCIAGTPAEKYPNFLTRTRQWIARRLFCLKVTTNPPLSNPFPTPLSTILRQTFGSGGSWWSNCAWTS